MARRPVPKAPRSTGNPNTVLIVVLVLMILVSITLGVFLYLAQDKIKVARDNEKKKADEATTAQKNFQEAQEDFEETKDYLSLKTRSLLDPGSVTDDEFKKLAALERAFSSKQNAAQNRARNDPRNDKLLTSLRKIQGSPVAKDPDGQKGTFGPYDARSGKVGRPVPDHLAELEKQRAALDDKFKKIDEEFTKYKEQYNAQIFQKKIDEEKDGLIKQHKAELAQVTKDVKAELEKIKASLDKDIEKIIKEERAKVEADREILKEQLNKEIAKLDAIRQELEAKARSRTKPFTHIKESPGRITQIEKNGQYVYINLGTDHRLKPQTTFSVYGRGPGGEPEADEKAKIEVVKVLDRSLSLARVTEVAGRAQPDRRTDTDASGSEGFWIRDPREFWKARQAIQQGDLLYSPIWDPNHRVRVVLAGVFDLDGDGSDDFKFFKSLIEEMGAEVDGYLDPTDEWKLKGKMDYQTEYLIVGDMPTSASYQATELKALAASALQLKDERTKLEDTAKRRGIEIVNLRRFLTRMGYSTMRTPVTRTAPPPAPDKPAEAPKEEKKEDKKEEKKEDKQE